MNDVYSLDPPTDPVERRRRYEMCRRRGHIASDRVLTSDPPQFVCCECGTHYHFGDRPIYETNVPEVIA